MYFSIPHTIVLHVWHIRVHQSVLLTNDHLWATFTSFPPSFKHSFCHCLLATSRHLTMWNMSAILFLLSTSSFWLHCFWLFFELHLLNKDIVSRIAAVQDLFYLMHLCTASTLLVQWDGSKAKGSAVFRAVYFLTPTLLHPVLHPSHLPAE